MFDHGTRPAAMPRVTSPATWKRKPSTVSDVPIRAQTSACARPASTRPQRPLDRGGACSRRCSPDADGSPCRAPAGLGDDELAPAAPERPEPPPTSAARQIERVRDERERIDGDRGPDEQHGDGVERERASPGMVSVYAGLRSGVTCSRSTGARDSAWRSTKLVERRRRSSGSSPRASPAYSMPHVRPVGRRLHPHAGGAARTARRAGRAARAPRRPAPRRPRRPGGSTATRSA